MPWTAPVPQELETLAEVVLAMLLGGVIGLERETANKPAGFRTHMLVAGAAAFLVALGVSLVDQFVAQTTDKAISADPIRVQRHRDRRCVAARSQVAGQQRASPLIRSRVQ